jgi:hypothetical protein
MCLASRLGGEDDRPDLNSELSSWGTTWAAYCATPNTSQGRADSHSKVGNGVDNIHTADNRDDSRSDTGPGSRPPQRLQHFACGPWV